ncbi:hypothetical protein GOP47_0012847 [Adiantum capillus-veneris]|uniref:Malectin-like domain-containing protein n=1 Tax=Adiantum capillus-veneris TaxID=13818 RepID=A0A9D4URN7_ADICA|nr:hypothetical protein GOP47_0012847 [Adiantum capillus-veneris]
MTILSLLTSITLSIIVFQAILLLWPGCSVRAQDGFISLDCGAEPSSPTYTDNNGIDWVPDASIMQEGEPVEVGTHSDKLLSRMRLFAGNASKYCYSLSNSMVKSKAFFLVRASFWAGASPLYKPQSVDGSYRFQLLIDADKWTDVKLPFFGNTTWWSHEMYVRAQHDSIDVCLARSSPDGDAPFISTLELRPLPSTLTPTSYMNSTGRDALYLGNRDDYTTAVAEYSFTRYPYDSFDRFWTSFGIAAEYSIITNKSVDGTNSVNLPPGRILQSALTFSTGFQLTLSSGEVGRTYVFVLYFAEINESVTAKGQRTFNIEVNGVLYNTEEPIDVFDRAVGAYEATSYTVIGSPSPNGEIIVNLTTINSSLFPPFVAAVESFLLNNVTSSAFSSSDDG